MKISKVGQQTTLNLEWLVNHAKEISLKFVEKVVIVEKLNCIKRKKGSILVKNIFLKEE